MRGALGSTPRLSRGDLTPHTALQPHDAVEVVVVHAVGGEAVLAATQQLHRAMGADDLRVCKQVQKLAAQLLALAAPPSHRRCSSRARRAPW